MEKKRRKGFTLIELLATIAIVALITVIAVVTINKIIDISNDNKNKISLKSIQSSARTYVEEFDKKWIPTEENAKIEYTCTTVGMLINKGFLKENLIGTTLNVKNNEGNEEIITLHKNTSIMVKRNTDTKVLLSEDLYFDSEVCNNLTNVNISFDVMGKIGDNNWYISDVTVIPKITGNMNKEKEPDYQIKINNNKINGGYTKNSNNNITITEEEENIDFCITVMDGNSDQEKEFCLSSNNGLINIDYSAPTIDDFQLDTTDFNLVANEANDNLSENIKYYFVYDAEPELVENRTYVINPSERVNNKEVKVYVKDEAGNISPTITKSLNITESLNGTVTSNVSYYCDLDNNAYDDETTATENCTSTETTASESDKYWRCNGSGEYSTKSAATTACTSQGSTTTKYSCSTGKLNGTKCYSSSNATETTMYGLTCEAGTTYGWNSGSSTTASSCTKSSQSCSGSSHVGNKKVTCSGPYGENSSSSNVLNCTESKGCTCTLTGTENGVKKYKKVCSQYYTKTTYTCISSTGSKTYKNKTGGTKSGGCPAGTTSTTESTNNTCSNHIGNSCTSSCKVCCRIEKSLTCSTSSDATKKYYCEEDGQTYTDASSCKKVGTVTSKTDYYCDEGYTLSDDEETCSKTITGNVDPTTSYICDLNNETYSDQNTAESNCTNQCNSGDSLNKENNACYSLN